MDKFVVKTLAFSSTKKEVPTFRPIWQLMIKQESTSQVRSTWTMDWCFFGCAILGPFIREKISRGLLWPRCTKYAKGTIYTNIYSQVNISRGLKKTILYHLYGVNIRVFCKPRLEKAVAYFLWYKWGYGPIVIDHLRKFVVDKHLDHSFGMLAVSFQLFTWCTGSAEDLIFFIYPN